jgi:hypothetical protein
MQLYFDEISFFYQVSYHILYSKRIIHNYTELYSVSVMMQEFQRDGKYQRGEKLLDLKILEYLS